MNVITQTSKQFQICHLPFFTRISTLKFRTLFTSFIVYSLFQEPLLYLLTKGLPLALGNAEIHVCKYDARGDKVIITTFCISLVVAEGSLQFKYHWPFMKYTNCPFKPVLLFLIDVCVCRCAFHIVNSKRQCFLCWLLLLFTTPGFTSVPLKSQSLPLRKPSILVYLLLSWSLCCYSFPGEKSNQAMPLRQDFTLLVKVSSALPNTAISVLTPL